jgi:hypothetical protein
MKKLLLVVAFSLVASVSYAGVIEDAQKQIDNETRAALVAQAKTLLKEKTTIEARLKKINTDLATLQSGVFPADVLSAEGMVLSGNESQYIKWVDGPAGR